MLAIVIMSNTPLLTSLLRSSCSDTLGTNVSVFERFCSRLDDHYLVLKSHTLKDAKRNIMREKGDVFEDLCYAMLKAGAFSGIPLTYLWKFKDIPDDIRASLGLSTRDMGIDLVGCTATHWVAFQCKYRKKPKAKRPDGQFNKWQVPWSELSTFLALATNNSFGQLVVMTSAKGVNWQGNYNHNCKVFARETFLGIPRSIWDTIHGDVGQKLGSTVTVDSEPNITPKVTTASSHSMEHKLGNTTDVVRAARNAWLNKLH